MIIRYAKIEDLQPIVEIYNQAVNAGFMTADTDTFSLGEKLEWFDEHQADKFPLLVCEIDGNIAGWLSVSPYRNGRMALRFTVEVSYYVSFDFLKRGIGSNLLERAIEICRNLGYKNLLAIVIDRNIASIGLLEKFGFERWGYLPSVADFDGIEAGHCYYGLRIAE